MYPFLTHRRFLPSHGQVGSNAVNLEHKASKVFRPKAADFAEVSRRSPPFERSSLCFLIPRPVVSTVAIKRYSVLKCPHQSGPQSTSQSGENMKKRTLLFTLLLCFVGAGVCFADDPMISTWKLNDDQSKIGAGSPMNNTVIYAA